MKTASANLASHLAGEVTTLCTCWKVTRTDAQVFGFTDYQDDLVISGTTYKAATGYRASAVVSTADLAVDNLELEGVLDSASITEADLYAGVWDYAEVLVFRVNYRSLADGVLYQRRGRLGQVKTGRTTFVAELRGLAQALQQVIGEVYTPSCRADLGDARCGVNLTGFTATGSVTGVTSRAVFADTARTQASDYFGGGVLTWTSGANNGRRMEVKSWVNGTKTFTLALPMVSTVAIGDTYSVIAGCRKRLADCRDKFANVVNFRGEPYVPQEADQWLK